MKKLLVFLVASLMVMSIAACGSSGASAAKQKELTDAYDAFKTEYESFETALNSLQATFDNAGLDAGAELDQYLQQLAASKTALETLDKTIKDELAKMTEKDIDAAVTSIKESTATITSAVTIINDQNAALEAALSGAQVDPNEVDPNEVDPNEVDPDAVDPDAVDPDAVDDATTPVE